MATLTDVTWMIRKGLVFGSIGSVVVLILGFAVWIGIQSITSPPPDPTPTPGLIFGDLPPLIFPESRKAPSEYNLSLIEGSPPESVYANVYFVPSKSATFFSRTNAEDLAKKLNFTQKPTIVDTTQYNYFDPVSKNRLSIDIPYKYFTFSGGSVEPSSYLTTVGEDEGRIKNAGRDYFQSINLWSTDLTNVFITYVIWTGADFIPSVNNNKTSFAQVNFHNPSANEIPILTAHPNEGIAHVVFGYNSQNQRVILASKYTYYAPDFSQASTYPTKSGTVAWKELQEGKGYIAQPVSTGGMATIRRIYLAYFLPDNYQPYLHPVWVFEGDDNFLGMVSAIDEAYIGVSGQ